jgi:hypothetical protein
MAHNTACEYLIYAFPIYNPQSLGRNRWQLISKNSDARDCMEEARRLYKAHDYARVEVKKKSYDAKKGRYFLSTYEIIEKSRPFSLYKIFIVALLVCAFAGQLYVINI